MKKENKAYLISEDVYYRHIDEEVHLYGLLRQLAFLAGKVKEPEDLEHLLETAVYYGEIADELFEGWNIPGRYLVYGDKADLNGLKEKELLCADVDILLEPEDEPGEYDGSDFCEVLAGLLSHLEGIASGIATVLAQLDAEAHYIFPCFVFSMKF